MLIVDLPNVLLAAIIAPEGRACRLVCRSFKAAYGPLRCGLRPTHIQSSAQLFEVLSSDRWCGITDLDLSRVAGTVDDGIVKVVTYCFPSLRKLVMSECAHVNAAACMAVLEPLAVTLHELDLGRCWLDTMPGPMLSVLSEAPPLPYLHSLALPEMDWLWTPQHMASLSRLSLLSSLTVLPFSRISWRQLPTTTHVWSALAALPALRRLAITSCDTIGDVDAPPFFPRMSLLTYLALGPDLQSGHPPHQAPIYPHPYPGISPLFPFFHLPHLRHLRLPSCHWPSQLPTAPLPPPPPPALQHLHLHFLLGDALFTSLPSLPSLTALNLTFHPSNTAVPFPPSALPPLRAALPSLRSIHLLNVPPSFPYHLISHLSTVTSLTLLPDPSEFYESGVAAALPNPAALLELSLPSVSNGAVNLLQAPPYPHLTRLHLRRCRGDYLLLHVAPLRTLRSLCLGGAKHVTDAGLQHTVASLPSLEALRVAGGALLTGSFCSSLPAGITHLALLHCPRVTGLLISQLAHLHNLRCLDLSGCTAVCGPPLLRISHLPGLSTLVLLGCKVPLAFVEGVLLPSAAHLQRVEVDGPGPAADALAESGAGSGEGVQHGVIVDACNLFYTSRRLCGEEVLVP